MRRTLPLLAAGTLACAAFTIAGHQGAPAVAAIVDCDAQTAELNAAELEFIDLLNAERAARGAPPLTPSPNLARAAAWKSEDAGAHGVLSHTDSLGRDPLERMRDCGYTKGGYWGENVLVGAATGRQAFNLWKSSPGHYANMTDPRFRVIGVGQYGSHWTATFGSIDDSGDPPPSPTPTPEPTPSVVAGVTLELAAGWNLVTFAGPAMPAGDAFRSLEGALVDAYWWDAQAGQWRQYAPGVPAYARAFTTMTPGGIYYLRLGAAATWTY